MTRPLPQTPPSLSRWFSGLCTTPVSLVVPRPVSTEASSVGDEKGGEASSVGVE